MLDRICKKCFFEKGDNFVCPKCGFDGVDNSESHALLIGTILNGKYIVGKVLGQGGFGITYLGYDINLGVKVAIKEYFPISVVARSENKTEILSASNDDGKSFKAGLNSFLEEARIVAMFSQNPNIITIREYFSENNTAYMVMDYILGMDLIHYVKQKRRPLDFLEAIELLNPIMSALAQVHNRNLLHRDISPDNIYITKDKTAILLDFGAARQFSMQTQSMSVILKVAYSPIEQHQRQSRSGPWTDVYAFAATFYHVITGKKPPSSIDRLEVDELELPSSLGVYIPKESEDALVKAMAVRAKDRYQTMAEFYNAINAPVFAMKEAEQLSKEKWETEQNVKVKKYELACENINTKQYKKAIKILKTIPDFKDSAQLIFSINKSISDKKQIDIENKQKKRLAKQELRLKNREQKARRSGQRRQQINGNYFNDNKIVTADNDVLVKNEFEIKKSNPYKKPIIITSILLVAVLSFLLVFYLNNNKTISASGQKSIVGNPIEQIFEGSNKLINEYIDDFYSNSPIYSKKNENAILFLKESNSFTEHLKSNNLACFVFDESNNVYSWMNLGKAVEADDLRLFLESKGYTFVKEFENKSEIYSDANRYLYNSPNTGREVNVTLYTDSDPRVGLLYEKVSINEEDIISEINYHNGTKSARLLEDEFVQFLGEEIIDFSGFADVETSYTGISFSDCEEYCCYAYSGTDEVNILSALLSENGFKEKECNKSYFGDYANELSYWKDNVKLDLYKINMDGNKYIAVGKSMYNDVRESLNEKEKDAYDLLKDEWFKLSDVDCDAYFQEESLNISFDYNNSNGFSIDEFEKRIDGYYLDQSITSDDYFIFINRDGEEINVSIYDGNLSIGYRKYENFEEELALLNDSENQDYNTKEFDSVDQLVELLDIDYVDMNYNENIYISWYYSNYGLSVNSYNMDDKDIFEKVIEKAREIGYDVYANEYSTSFENDMFSWYIGREKDHAYISILPGYYGSISIN